MNANGISGSSADFNIFERLYHVGSLKESILDNFQVTHAQYYAYMEPLVILGCQCLGGEWSANIGITNESKYGTSNTRGVAN